MDGWMLTEMITAGAKPCPKHLECMFFFIDFTDLITVLSKSPIQTQKERLDTATKRISILLNSILFCVHQNSQSHPQIKEHKMLN